MLGPESDETDQWWASIECLERESFSSSSPKSWRFAPDGHDHDGPTMAPRQAIDQLLLTEVPEGADGMEDSIDDRGEPQGLGSKGSQS